ncbi:MAG: hypothetical protein M0021_15375 [Clostridia bacterium]|nr:hypothetical protein [Clostridia bacterium]
MRKISTLLVALFILFGLFFITGCSNISGRTPPGTSPGSKIDEAQFELWLKLDAIEAFNAAIDRDYRRLTVISGSLNKLRSSDHPELVLGTVLGATESTIFIKESEYRRMDNNINLPAAVKKELAPAGLLSVLNKNHLVLEHTYRDVLKPYAEKVVNKQTLSVGQEKSVDKTVDLLLGITQYYSRLSQDRKNMSVDEVESLVRELDKLQTQLGAVYFPAK